MNIIKRLKNSNGSWNQEVYDNIVMWKSRYLKELYRGLDDEDPDIREGCAEALGEIGLLESVPFLIEHISDPKEQVRWDIMNSIEMILGFQPGALKEWTGFQLKDRHQLKRKLKEFWEINKDYILKGRRGSVRDSFSFAGGQATSLWHRRFKP